MHRRILLPLAWVILCQKLVSAQFLESFTDGELHSNPSWTGDTASFEVRSGSLFLNAQPITDTASIWTASQVSLSSEWLLKIGFDFNPSSGNYCKVYLMASDQNTRNQKGAYVVKVGGTEDEISLYRQEGDSEIEIIDGRDKTLDRSVNNIRIKILRSADNEWTLLSDTGSMVFISEGSVIDSSHLQSQYFGISCRYTSTRADKFSFDDIQVSGKAFRDSLPPRLISHTLIDSLHWVLSFDETVAELSPSDKVVLSAEVGDIQAKVAPLDDHVLQLEFGRSLPHGIPLKLQLDSIRDSLGNAASLALFGLYNNVHLIKEKDLLLNEIMFDPSPSQGLPEAEYLELFNRSNSVLELKNWILADEKDSLLLLPYILEPGQYLLLCHASDSDKFGPLPLMALTDFPSLSNSGEKLQLKRPDGQIIDEVKYDPNWIKDSEKKEGGWSLELINSKVMCSHAENWDAGLNPIGGSPGMENSIHDTNSSLIQAQFGPILTIDDSLLGVALIGAAKWPSDPLKHLEINPELDVQSVNLFDHVLEIEFAYPPLRNKAYDLKLNNIKDCFETQLTGLSMEVIFPDRARSGELIINEILFNPKTGGSDFVELINDSKKYIDLGQYLIGGIREDGIREVRNISVPPQIIGPGALIALCADSSAVKSDYSYRGSLLKCDLPYFGDKSGTVTVLDSDSQMIDLMSYREDMHFALLNSSEGVSLEKIRPSLNGILESSWMSAAESIGFASPGMVNSQYSLEDPRGIILQLNETIISPDGDGYQDYVEINIRPDRPGFVASLQILDAHGSLIKTLANTELLSMNNHYLWDGLNEHGAKAPIGFYLILYEAFHPDGKKIREVRSLVLANKL